MKATHMSTALSGAQFSHHRDLYELLPRRPKLIPELIFIPENATRVAVYGARQPRILTCAQGMTVLATFLDRLNGSYELETLLADDGAISGDNALGMLSLLFRYGFLEEGEGLDSDDRRPLASYCGRFVDNTRLYANRTAAINAARSRRLVLVCPEPLVPTLRQVMEPVVASVDVLSQPQGSALNGWDDALVIFDGSVADAERRESINALHLAGVRYLTCFIGANSTLVGPLTLPGISASYQCAHAQCDMPEPANDQHEVAFRAVYAAHELLQLLLGLSSENYINKVVVHSHRGEGVYTLAYKVARIPGTALSGLASAQYLPPGSEAFSAWLHHTGTRIPPRDWLPPRSHQMHFTLDNLNRHASRPARLHGEQHLMLSDSPLTTLSSPPWLHTAAESHPLTLDNLAWLLRNATGYQMTKQGEQRRIAPSGGQLTSCDLFVVVRQSLPGLACGIWFYQGEEHRLVKVEGVDHSQLERLLQQPAEPLSLIVSANLNRVRGKYNDFSYNIVNLDAGVVNQYCALSASAAGWTLREDHRIDLHWLAALLFLNEQDNPHIVCQIMHLEAQPQPSAMPQIASYETSSSLVAVSHLPKPAAALTAPAVYAPLLSFSRDRQFAELLLQRRAAYDYADEPPQPALLAALVGLSHFSLKQSRARGLPDLPMQPWLLLPADSGELSAGIYQCSGADPAEWQRRDQGFGRQQLGECINQSAFHRAGALLVWVADLEKTLQQYGAAGYRMQLQSAASHAMQCWLAATDCGLTGTLAGGFIEEGLMRHAAADGLREAPLFCLVLAEPLADGGE